MPWKGWGFKFTPRQPSRLSRQPKNTWEDVNTACEGSWSVQEIILVQHTQGIFEKGLMPLEWQMPRKSHPSAVKH